MRAWMFCSVTPGGASPRMRGQSLQVGAVDGLDGYLVEIHPQPLGRLPRVVLGPRARVARGHGNGVDLVLAQGVRGDAGGERGVDAAADAHDHLLEAVLAHVVAHTEAQRRVDLGLDAQTLRDGAGDGRRRRGKRRRCADGGRAAETGGRAGCLLDGDDLDSPARKLVLHSHSSDPFGTAGSRRTPPGQTDAVTPHPGPRPAIAPRTASPGR